MSSSYGSGSDAMFSMFVPGIIDDLISYNNGVFTSPCTIYRQVTIDNGQGGTTYGFDTGTATTCRVDDILNGPMPGRPKDNIDVEKIQRDIFVPVGTLIGIGDKLVTNAGQADPTFNEEYRVVDMLLETDETDIGLMVEIYN